MTKIEWEEVQSGEVVKLEEGQDITGTFVKIVEKESDEYGKSYAVTVEVEGEEKLVFLNSIAGEKVLDKGFIEGDLIRILYVGLKKSTTSKHSYKEFSIFRGIKK